MKPIMHTQMFESVVTVYNRERRRLALLKLLAWICRMGAAVMLLMGFGALLALVNSLVFTLVSIPLIAAGVWGQHYLSTRH